MPFRNSIIALACCILLVVTASLISAFNVREIETKSAALNLMDSETYEQLERLEPNVPAPPRRRTAVSPARRDLIAAVQRSRQMLKQKNELYHQQKSQLIRRINDYDKLQEEYLRLNQEHEDLKRQFDELWRDADSSLMMFGELLEKEVPSPADATATTEGTADGITAVTGAEDVLPTDQSSTTATDGTPIEVAVLEWNLQQTQTELSELEASFERMSQISNAASVLLVENGSASVPLLMEMLDEREPSGVRVWSAWMLGNLGPLAVDAVERLQSLSSEADAELSQAADEAVRRITGSGA